MSKLSTLAVCLCAAGPAWAAGGSSVRLLDAFNQAITTGTPYAHIRYRYEYVDQDGFMDAAQASTVRSRLGYRSGDFRGLRGALEFENTSVLGWDDYNSGTNGRTGFPTIADPAGSEVNQAYLSYSGIPGMEIKYGRHHLKRHNVRFIGDVGWRQNNQTHDGLTFAYGGLQNIELFYGYTYNVNRPLGNDHPVGDYSGDVHMFDLAYTGFSGAKGVAYTYLVDLENAPAVSSATYGLNLAGRNPFGNHTAFLYDIEYARQQDYGDNLTDYGANYYRVEPGIAIHGLTLKAGYEMLGSDGGAAAFSTPLATLHKYNGWADKFLSTPTDGLEDIYGVADYKVSGMHHVVDGTRFVVAYHHFAADEGGADYGSEWNAAVTRDLGEHFAIGGKYANYQADTFASDTEKVMLSLEFKFE